MPTTTVPALLAGVLFLALVSPRCASAAWPPFGRPLATAVGDQERPQIASDGADGAIVVWVDRESHPVSLFAQHVLASGVVDPAWPQNGRPLLTDPAALAGALGGQDFPVVVSDGAGGAVVAWTDGRNGPSGTDAYAQHVLASGLVDPDWPANGAALCTAIGPQSIPALVSDGSGGAIVTWIDGRGGGDGDIYAQHVLASGVVDANWPVDGAALCTAPAIQAFPKITSDGSGGAIVTWYDLRSGVTGIDIYAQRVLAAGTVDPAWPVDGRALCTATGSQFDPRIVSDGAQGALVAWLDTRDGTAHIYAQRVLPTGGIAPGWPVDGRAVNVAGGEQLQVELVTDGAHGAIVAWSDLRDGVIQNLFGQHVQAAGTLDPGWPANGRALSPATMDPLGFALATDGAGGAIVAFEQGSDIFAQHLLASGALDSAYPDTGRAVCTLPSQQSNVAVVAAGVGGAIAVWTDARSGVDADIFAMQVLDVGTVGVLHATPSGVSFARPSPNPARGSFTLRFGLAREALVRLAIYDASGRHVRELASGPRPAGEHALAWDLRDGRGTAVRAGFYFARLEAGGSSDHAEAGGPGVADRRSRRFDCARRAHSAPS